MDDFINEQIQVFLDRLYRIRLDCMDISNLEEMRRARAILRDLELDLPDLQDYVHSQVTHIERINRQNGTGVG